MDPLTLALIVGLGSGVIGGAVSQLIAGAFKSRGDTRQITLTKELAKEADERWQKEQAFEREKVLAGDRRKLFIDTAHALQRTREVLKAANQRQGEGWRTWDKAVRERVDKLFMVETELRIIAPELAPPVRRAALMARSIRDSHPQTPTSDIDRMISDFTVEAGEAMSQMRNLLGTDIKAGGVVVSEKTVPTRRERRS